MKYNYYVNGKKATYTTFADCLRVSIAYSKETIITNEVHKKANEKIRFCRKMLQSNALIKKFSWKSPIFENEMMLFTITRAE